LLEDAAAALGRALRLNPQCGLVYWALGTVYLAQGRPEEALGAFEREVMESLRLLGLTSAQHALGRRLESEAALRELVAKGAEDSAFQIAQAFAYRGEADTAFTWLERAFAQRDPGLSNMQQDPMLRNLHADARWQPFLKKMRLAD
jgi:tetratricopeptide (TPR) repeat protein